jgi:hypothetical protein
VLVEERERVRDSVEECISECERGEGLSEEREKRIRVRKWLELRRTRAGYCEYREDRA